MTSEEAYDFGMETFRMCEDPFVGARFLMLWFKIYMEEFPDSRHNAYLRKGIEHVEKPAGTVLISAEDLLLILPTKGAAN